MRLNPVKRSQRSFGFVTTVLLSISSPSKDSATGAAWIEAEPEVLSLFPGAEGTVTIHFRPPKSPNTPPGPTPFGVKVVSGEDPTGSAVEEGVLTVGRFADRSVEIYPVTQRGRRKGEFQIAVDNRGNAPIEVEFSGSDPENACRYAFAQGALTVEPGTAHFTKFEVIPHDRFWKGPPKTHQFQVLVTERARHAELPAPQMAGAPGRDAASADRTGCRRRWRSRPPRSSTAHCCKRR